MRFRTRLVNNLALERVLLCVEKLCHNSSEGPVDGFNGILVMSQESWSFRIGTEASGGSGVLAFADLLVEGIFEKYRIMSTSDNMIVLAIDLSNLLRAVKSSQKASKVVISLSRKADSVFLSFMISLSSDNMVNLVQDVPVNVLPASKAHETEEPEMPTPGVKFHMPNLKHLRNVLDKMKALSQTVELTASNAGELQWLVRTELACVRTTYRGLGLESEDNSSLSSCICYLDLRRLHRALMCASFLDTTSAIGCIIEKRCLVLYLDLGYTLGTLTYYIPLLVE